MADHTLPTNEGAIDMSFQTESDLSSLQYYFVMLDGDELVVTATENSKILGILQNAPDGSSEVATARVRIQGTSRLKLDEAVAFGNFLTSSSSAKGEVADAAHEEYGAKALGSADDGDLALVQICFGEVTAAD